MAYFKPNLGHRYTNTPTVVCLLSDTVDTGVYTPPMRVQFRELGGDWTPVQDFVSYKLLGLSPDPGTKIVECRFIDSLGASFSISQSVELLDTEEERYAWMPETQELANNLPAWHPGRRLRSSNWQKFMNITSNALRVLKTTFNRVTNSMFLSTAPVDEIDTVARVRIDPNKLEAEKSDPSLILNGSFGLQRVPWIGPEDWWVSTTNGAKWNLDRTEPLYGFQALRADLNIVGSSYTAIQEVRTNLKEGESITAGIYYKNDAPFTGAVIVDLDYHLKLVALMEDGTVEEVTSTLDPETDNTWYMTSVSYTPSKRVTRLFFIINLDKIPGLDSINLLDGAFLHRGEKHLTFDYGYTHPWYLINPIESDIKTTGDVWLTDSYHDFWDRSIPTRVGPSAITLTAGPFTAPDFTPTAHELQDALRQRYDIGYAVTNNKIGMYVTNNNSLIREYTPAHYYKGAGFIPDDNLKVEAITHFKDYIWAILSWDNDLALDEYRDVLSIYDPNIFIEADFDIVDNKIRYLAVINKYTPAGVSDYMEIISLIPLGHLDEPVLDMEFRQDDPTWLFYRTATNEYFVRLYYDYGLVTPESFVLLREV